VRDTHITRPWRLPPGRSLSVVPRGRSRAGGNTPRAFGEAGAKGRPARPASGPVRGRPQC